ncbi:tRNA(Ile)(2)-agmatinylcytidine synthase [Haloparvum alkalitolerans]|uniref:TiaS agmantine-binding domain-containing protein n=1 Tax=Haloparvum alkalitolerans TaxID=1042953 RepID=UPI003CF5B727
MTIVGLDDTDSRERGMCTTYAATRLAERIAAAGGRVECRLLVRLNPGVKHKTRGNAALALHTDLPADEAFELAGDLLAGLAEADDPRTSPGVVVAPLPPDAPAAIPDEVAGFARRALRERLDLDEATALADEHGFDHAGFGAGGDPDADAGDRSVEGRGRIGAIAAVGALAAFDDWTHEHVAYRRFERCGTPRRVDEESVFAAAEFGYPTVWDTVDRGTGEAVCVPNAPGPILYGIRGDEPEACREVAARIDAESVDRAATFLTNQGTDAHLAPGRLGDLREGAGYRVDCVVAGAPETRRGGHVFVPLARPDAVPDDRDHPSAVADADLPDDATAQGAAFAPTDRFRDRVRALRPGDRLTACGEYEAGTLKLEKFAVRELVGTELVTPTCPDCGRTMSSAGRGQGYRCRDCGTAAPGKIAASVDRALDRGWYEVPPCARRHVAKPLVRGGFDAPTHPER